MRIRLILTAGLLIPLAAEAAPLPPNEAGRAAYARFKALDQDGDRSLTVRELTAPGREAGADALFSMLDRDGDARLSPAEMQGRGKSGQRLGRFDAYDVDKSGFVTRREFPVFPDPHLLRALDTDGDARLALGEIDASFAGWRPGRTAEAEPLARAARADERDAPRCWVPIIGNPDKKWWIQGPVTAERCVTGGTARR